jgi:hypothetical protein
MKGLCVLQSAQSITTFLTHPKQSKMSMMMKKQVLSAGVSRRSTVSVQAAKTGAKPSKTSDSMVSTCFALLDLPCWLLNISQTQGACPAVTPASI